MVLRLACSQAEEKKARSELGVAMATAVSSRYELADDYLPY